MTTQTNLSIREKATIKILFFIIRLLNPTGYTHQVEQFQKELEKGLFNETE